VTNFADLEKLVDPSISEIEKVTDESTKLPEVPDGKVGNLSDQTPVVDEKMVKVADVKKAIEKMVECSPEVGSGIKTSFTKFLDIVTAPVPNITEVVTTGKEIVDKVEEAAKLPTATFSDKLRCENILGCFAAVMEEVTEDMNKVIESPKAEVPPVVKSEVNLSDFSELKATVDKLVEFSEKITKVITTHFTEKEVVPEVTKTPEELKAIEEAKKIVPEVTKTPEELKAIEEAKKIVPEVTKTPEELKAIEDAKNPVPSATNMSATNTETNLISDKDIINFSDATNSNVATKSKDSYDDFMARQFINPKNYGK